MSIQNLPELIYNLAFMFCISLGLVSYTRAIWNSLNQKWIYLQRLHQIPCDRCVFFTGEYHLKCTIHPCKALKEEAIGCLDYQQVKLD
jgi:hypothetical protein